MVIIAASDKLFLCNNINDTSNIYSDIGSNGREDANSSTSLIINIEKDNKRLLNSTSISEASKQNKKWNHSNDSTPRRILTTKPSSQEANLKDINIIQQYTEGREPDLYLQAVIEEDTKSDSSNF